MARLSFLLAFISFYFLQAYSITPEAETTKRRIFDDCRAKDGNLTQSQVQLLYDMKSVTELSDHQCYILCLGTEYGIISKTGVDIVRALKVLADIWPNPIELPFITPITVTCIVTTPFSTNACKYYYDQLYCFFQKVNQQRGVGFF